ncbi:MAG: B12-binding domain-containing radical SAM protein [Candidatus Helarchaeota archaeon]
MKPEILLFHPPNVLKQKALRYSSISPLLCGYGLLHIGVYLKECGYEVECWNIPLFYKLGFNNNHFREILKNYDPIMIGIELNWLHLSKGALDLATFLKEIYPEVPIIIGGVHATLFAEEIIRSYNQIDVVVKGEAEKILGEIANKIDANQSYLDIYGIVTRDMGKFFSNEGKNLFENIDQVPPYSPKILMPKILNSYDLGIINTCRGPCIFNCIHCLGAKSNYCLNPRPTIKFHSVSWIIKQIQILLDHVKQISIQDYIYTNPKFMMELCKAIRKEKLQDEVEFFNLALVPTGSITRGLMSELSRAGIDNIDIGIESGSNTILQLLNRPYNTQQALKIIKNAIETGILPKTYWMITGLEKPTDLNANQAFLEKTITLGAVPRWVTPLCIVPKTYLSENALKYKVYLKMKSFQDFQKFSTEKFNREAFYPELVTHETMWMNRSDILIAVSQLKSQIIKNRELIFEKLEENKEFYQGAKPQLYENLHSQRTKEGLKYLRSTFF